MSVYRTGTVTLRVGYKNVVGNGTVFNTNVTAGNLFKRTNVSTIWEVASVTNATNLDLTASYSETGYNVGDYITAVPYQVVTDYTPNYSYPELSLNDLNFQNIYTRALRMIDADLKDLVSNSVTATNLKTYSPNGNEWVLKVSNTGTVTASAL